MEREAADKAEDRLQRLEKQVRDARTIAMAGAAGVAALCLFSIVWVLTGGLSGEVRAERFTVLHENGRPGVLLTVRGDNPVLSLYDLDGDLRAAFELQGKGQPVLSFLDKGRHYRSVFGLSDEGNPGIAFWDNGSRARVNFKLADGGEPALGLFGREGEEGPSAILYLSDETGPILSFRDVKGQDWVVGDGR
jgi:hypothetical protein